MLKKVILVLQRPNYERLGSVRFPITMKKLLSLNQDSYENSHQLLND